MVKALSCRCTSPYFNFFRIALEASVGLIKPCEHEPLHCVEATVKVGDARTP